MHMGWVVAIGASMLSALLVVFGAWLLILGAGRVHEPVDSDFAVKTPLGRVAGVFAFGAGTFFSAVLLEFLPYAFEAGNSSGAMYVFLGAAALWTISFASEAMFDRTTGGEAQPGAGSQLSAGACTVIVISLTLHTLLEGASLAEAVDGPLSASTLTFVAATLFHKLPEGFLWALALFSLAGSRARLGRILVLPAFGTLIGSVLGVWLGPSIPETVHVVLHGVLGGALLYICLVELLPGVREHSVKVQLWFPVGALVAAIPILLS